MKKIISYICVIGLLISMISFSIVSADNENKLSVSSVTVRAGEEVQVTLSASSSTLISGMELDIKYESDAMELLSVTSAENGVFPSVTFQGSENLTANPYYLSWDNSLSEPVTANGNLAVLKFKIKADAYNGEYAVAPLFSAGGAFDNDLNDVDFITESGCITVTDGIVPENPITTHSTTKATTKSTTTTTSKATTSANTTTTTVPSNRYTLYSWEENTEGLTETNINLSRVAESAHDGEYSLKIYPKTSVWNKSGYNVDTASLKNYITIDIPSGLNITGDVGFYAYTTSSNTSNYEAYGVKMADGKYYFTKYNCMLGTSGYKDFKVTRTTLYKLDDPSVTVSLTSANFADTAEDSNRVAAIVFADAGTNSSSNPSYIDDVYYEADSEAEITTSVSTTKPLSNGKVELTSAEVSFVNAKYFAGTNVSGNSDSGFIAKMQGGAWSANDKFFGLKFDESVFDLKPERIEIKLRTEGNDYKGNYSWFSTSDYTSMQTQPAIESQVERVNIYSDSLHTISTTGTLITLDLTDDNYKDIVTKKFNYYYLCAKRANAGVTAMYCESVTVYYTESAPIVTIDGEQIPVIDGKVTMPSTADIYLNDSVVYKANEVVEVAENLSLTSYSLGLAMKQGASIRLNGLNGIRFYTDVDSSVIDSLKSANSMVALGTLIAPKDLIGDKDLTLDCGAKTANVIYAASLNAKWNTSGFVGSLINIKESNSYNSQTGNIGRDFVGRGYVTVTVGENSRTVYADYYDNDVINNTRSVAYVAKFYKENSDEYSSLPSTTKDIVDKWASVY